MKKNLLHCALPICFALTAFNANAQIVNPETQTETTVVVTKKKEPVTEPYQLTKPLNILKAKIAAAPVLCYERQIRPNQSLQIGVRMPFGFGILTKPSDWYVESEYRFYFLHKTHLTSFYAAPCLTYASETKDPIPNLYEVYQSLRLGAKLGYQLRIGKLFNVDVWGGHEATMFTNNVSDHAPQNNFSRDVALNSWLLGISFGIAF